MARHVSHPPAVPLDHALLEELLFLALPHRDTKPLAQVLLARFGSYAAVLSVPSVDLCRIGNLGEAGAMALTIVFAAAVRLLKAELINAPLLCNWDSLMNYLNAMLSREKIEQFRVLFLDESSRLLADEMQGRGTLDHTPVYPREVVKRALQLHATAIILVHNHPSGDPTPSREDIEMTREVKEAAAVLYVVLHDHIIVGNGRWVSFRLEGLL